MTTLDYQPGVWTENRRGEWVPVISPLHLRTRKQCSCGRRLWTGAAYRGHYALKHILGLD